MGLQFAGRQVQQPAGRAFSEGGNDGPKRIPFWRAIHALESNVGCSDSLDLLRMFTAHSQLADNIFRQIE